MEALRKAVQTQLERSRISAGLKEEVAEFDAANTLQAVLACLLADEPSKQLPADLTHAFQTLSMLSQLASIQLSVYDQARIAQVIYVYWSSPLPSIVCRNLLEQMMARKQGDTSAFLTGLLRLSQQNFSIGNKRPLHILAQVFDYTTQEQLDEYFPDLWDKLVLSLQEQAGALQAAKILANLGLGLADLAERLYPLLLIEMHGTRQVIFETLLPPLLAGNSEVLESLLQQISPTKGSQAPVKLLSYLSLVKAGLNVKDAEFDPPQIEQIIGDALVHSDPTVCFEALRLLLRLPAGSTPSQRIPLQHFSLYRTFWKYNIGDTDSPSVRTGLVGVWKDCLARCKLSSTAAARDAGKQAKLAQAGKAEAEHSGREAEEYVQAVREFLEDWSANAVDQLQSFKPYRCQMNALRYLEVLLADGIDPDYLSSIDNDTGKVPKTRKSTTPSWQIRLHIAGSETFVQRLVVCISSTYEDIKHTAYQLLLRCPISAESLQAVKASYPLLIAGKRDADIISGTLLLRLTIRKESCQQASDAEESLAEQIMKVSLDNSRSIVGIAEMLSTSERQLVSASADFERAAEHAPIHGAVSAINQLLLDYPPTSPGLKVYRGLYERSLRLVQQVWDIIRPFLCKDTENMDGQAEQDETSMDQVVLNAAWRALKEAGDLLSTILSLPVLSNVTMWSLEELEEHGSLFGTWLLEVGHRGAFAHISNAYGRLCSTLVKSRSNAADLPSRWLQSHLTEILDRDRPTQRRSAGLPYLILGVLAGSSANSPNMELAFSRLFASLRQDSTASSATRSHAINSLRVLFLDGKLTTAVKKYVEPAFVVAVEGFGASDWHVRNASLLLYASLIQRTFGTRREHLPLHKRMSIIEFFKQYKALHPILLQELKSQYRSTSPEALGSVFSALLLLSLLQTPEDSEAARVVAEPFLPYVESCAASPVWKVREAAAAALSGLIPAERTWEHILAVLASLDTTFSQNEIHGRLLQCTSLVKTASTSAPPAFWSAAISAIQPYIAPAHSLPVRTASLDLVLLYTGSYPEPLVSDLASLAPGELAKQRVNRPGEASWQRALAQALLRFDSGAWLLPILSGSTSAQEQGLLYLATQRFDIADNRLLGRLEEIATASAEDIGNAIKAIDILATLSSKSLAKLDAVILRQVYEETSIPMVKEGFLPLLAKLRHSDKAYERDILQDIENFSTSESVSARMSACRALSNFGQGCTSFALGQLLLRFLQDEDLDVRQLAATIASARYAGGQSLQSTRAVELLWTSCIDQASESDAERLLLEHIDLLEDKYQDADEQAGVLFAVEKTNVYIDTSINATWASRIFHKYRKHLAHSAAVNTRQDRYREASVKLRSYVDMPSIGSPERTLLSTVIESSAMQELNQFVSSMNCIWQDSDDVRGAAEP